MCAKSSDYMRTVKIYPENRLDFNRFKGNNCFYIIESFRTL